MMFENSILRNLAKVFLANALNSCSCQLKANPQEDALSRKGGWTFKLFLHIDNFSSKPIIVNNVACCDHIRCYVDINRKTFHVRGFYLLPR